jgi:nucleotide-binding universal stress UspA family protein
LLYRDESLNEVKAHVEEARAWLRDVIVPAATEGAAGASVKVHLFVDKTTASSDDLAATLAKAADDLDAAVLVLSRSNKTALDRLFVGSVAGKTQRICGRPVLLVTSGGGGGGV